MTRPTTIANLGTSIPSAVIDSVRAVRSCQSRLVNIKVVSNNQMPTVTPGQVYEDLDPRHKGRFIVVLGVSDDYRVMVRNITTPEKSSRCSTNTAGNISFIALRRFVENSRGFRLIRNSTIRSVNAYLLAARLCTECDLDITDLDIRVCDAIIGILGNRKAHQWLNDVIKSECLPDLYTEDGPEALIQDVFKYTRENKMVAGWEAVTVSKFQTAKNVANHRFQFTKI